MKTLVTGGDRVTVALCDTITAAWSKNLDVPSGAVAMGCDGHGNQRMHATFPQSLEKLLAPSPSASAQTGKKLTAEPSFVVPCRC